MRTMIRDQKFKLNLCHTVNNNEGQLFDMQQDPREENDLWANSDYTDIRESLTKQILDFLVQQEIRFRGKQRGETLPPKWI